MQDNNSHHITRRNLIKTIAGTAVYGLSGLSLKAGADAVQADAEIPFIGVTEDGPLYPPGEIPWDDDLTRTGPTGGVAQGKPLYLFGRILTRQGRPLKNAVVEIWQTDFNGNYRHPKAWSQDELDPNFGYFGKVGTNAEGFYLFKTIRPRWYLLKGLPGTPEGGLPRAAHIHMKMKHVEHGVQTTEAYFDNASHEEIAPIDRVFLSRPKRIRDRILLAENSPNDYRDLGFEFEDDAICCRYDLAFLL